MKKMHFLTEILLAVLITSGLGLNAFAENGLVITISEPVETVEKAKFGEGYSGFYDAGIVVETEDGKKEILDPFGENKIGRSFDDVEAFGNGNECFIATDLSRLPNALSLVKADGTLLIEDAAIIDMLSFSLYSGGRFVSVSYAVKETDNEEDCFLLSYADRASIEVEFEPGEGDTMYTGYTRVFDLLEGQFIDNVRVNQAGDRVEQVGDNLLVNYHDYETEDELFSPGGELVGTVKGSDKNRDFFVSRTEDKTYLVKDCNLNELAVLDFSPYRIYGNAEAFAEKTDEGYHVVDSAGAEICDILFRYIPNEAEGFLIGEDDEGNCAVITLEGETLISFEDSVKSVHERPMGYFEIRYRDESYAVLLPDGTIVPLESNLTMDLLSYMNQDDVHEIYIMNEKNYRETKGLIFSVGLLMFSVRNQDGNYALYNAWDGSQLIEPKYENYHYSNGYIYAENGEFYDLYPCTAG